MHHTRIFRNGNSQAIRIPADLAYPDSDMPVSYTHLTLPTM